MNKKYDFIIIGGGSSGIVAASQIISKLNATVLIIEEGPSDWHPLIKIPAGIINFLEKEKFVKNYRTIPQKQLNGRSHYITQASILGGGSSINGMVYMRGRPSDYDEWSISTKEKNWSYQSMLPYFKLVEDNNRLFDENHGIGGDLKVSNGFKDLPGICFCYAFSSPWVSIAQVARSPGKRETGRERQTEHL